MGERIIKKGRHTSSSPGFPLSAQLGTSESTTARRSQQDQAAFASHGAQSTSNALSRSFAGLTLSLGWVDSLSESSHPLASLRKAATDLAADSLDDIVEERHLGGLCGYPACEKKPAGRYDPDEEKGRRKAMPRTRERAGHEVLEWRDGEMDSPQRDAFCSNKCERRYEAWRAIVARKGLGRFLEEEEEAARQRKAKQEEQDVFDSRMTDSSTVSTPTGVLRMRTEPAVASSSTATATGIFADLVIVEREPGAAPKAPDPSKPAPTFELPPSQDKMLLDRERRRREGKAVVAVGATESPKEKRKGVAFASGTKEGEGEAEAEQHQVLTLDGAALGIGGKGNKGDGLRDDVAALLEREAPRFKDDELGVDEYELFEQMEKAMDL